MKARAYPYVFRGKTLFMILAHPLIYKMPKHAIYRKIDNTGILKSNFYHRIYRSQVLNIQVYLCGLTENRTRDCAMRMRRYTTYLQARL